MGVHRVGERRIHTGPNIPKEGRRVDSGRRLPTVVVGGTVRGEREDVGQTKVCLRSPDNFILSLTPGRDEL